MIKREFKQSGQIPKVGSGHIKKKIKKPTQWRPPNRQIRSHQNDAGDCRRHQRHSEKRAMKNPLARSNAVYALNLTRYHEVRNCFYRFGHMFRLDIKGLESEVSFAPIL